MLVSLKLDAVFSRWCTLNDQVCISSDPPPPPHNSWFASCLYCLHLTRFLSLTAVDMHTTPITCVWQ
jgi:hypothetical protein